VSSERINDTSLEQWDNQWHELGAVTESMTWAWSSDIISPAQRRTHSAQRRSQCRHNQSPYQSAPPWGMDVSQRDSGTCLQSTHTHNITYFQHYVSTTYWFTWKDGRISQQKTNSKIIKLSTTLRNTSTSNSTSAISTTLDPRYS